jgi:hypothetical protein
MEGTDSDADTALLRRAREALAEAEHAVAQSDAVLTATRLVREPGSMVTRCAWCSRIKLGRGWIPAESVPRFFARYVEEHGTHGICDECVRELEVTGHTRPLP